MYCFSNYLEYFISGINTICEDKGAISLVDEKSCKEAVEKLKNSWPDTYFSTSITDSDYPKGCYLYNNGDAVYLNLHESGARSDYAQPICKKSNGK